MAQDSKSESSLSASIQQHACGVDMASCGPLLASRPRPVVSCNMDPDDVTTMYADVSSRSSSSSSATSQLEAKFNQKLCINSK